MISFNRFTQLGRFGNQLFQYALLRTAARRLDVPFYCPSWLGDEIFALNDAAERAAVVDGIFLQYQQPTENCGFDPRAQFIQDHTDILGYFQSPQHFDNAAARRWYTFRPEAVAAVRAKYQGLNFGQCVGVHFRFGDMVDNMLYIDLKADYYRKALAMVRPYRQVLVFSDDPAAARERMSGVCADFILIEGNRDFEDLYLLTQCRAVVCSVSTFSWWGAWLNDHPHKKVAAPREWLRPGQRIRNDGLTCPEWSNLRVAHPIHDNHKVVIAKKILGKALVRARSRDFAQDLRTVTKFIVNRCLVRR
jgi:hypothetical protein